ncbi:hypothetical protein HDU76_010412, partial [Blyttiomyces sp. JEL0837]
MANRYMRDSHTQKEIENQEGQDVVKILGRYKATFLSLTSHTRSIRRPNRIRDLRHYADHYVNVCLDLPPHRNRTLCDIINAAAGFKWGKTVAEELEEWLQTQEKEVAEKVMYFFMGWIKGKENKVGVSVQQSSVPSAVSAIQQSTATAAATTLHPGATTATQPPGQLSAGRDETPTQPPSDLSANQHQTPTQPPIAPLAEPCETTTETTEPASQSALTQRDHGPSEAIISIPPAPVSITFARTQDPSAPLSSKNKKIL